MNDGASNEPPATFSDCMDGGGPYVLERGSGGGALTAGAWKSGFPLACPRRSRVRSLSRARCGPSSPTGS